jgi:hypothetical protein
MLVRLQPGRPRRESRSSIGRWPNGKALVLGNENHRLHHSGETSLSARAAPDLTRGASARTAHACSTARAPGLYPGTTGSTPGVGSSSSNRRDPTRTKRWFDSNRPHHLWGRASVGTFPFEGKIPPGFSTRTSSYFVAALVPRARRARSRRAPPVRSSTRRCPTSSPTKGARLKPRQRRLRHSDDPTLSPPSLCFANPGPCSSNGRAPASYTGGSGSIPDVGSVIRRAPP